MYEFLKITAHLQSGIIAPEGMPLDGVLMFQKIRERDGFQFVTTTEDIFPETDNPIELPFAKHNDGRSDWFWACSFAVWPNNTVHGTDYWNKRFDLNLAGLIDWKGKVQKIDTSQGKFKPYHMPVFYRMAPTIHWYAVGNKPEIERLLYFCTHLGKKTSQGWGAVRQWNIESYSFDWSISDGVKLLRPIPKVGTGRFNGIRPPYRLEKNQFECVFE